MIRPTTIALLLTLLLPPAIYVAFSASSMSVGLLVCAVIWIFVGLTTTSRPFMLKRSDGDKLALVMIGIGFLTAHVILSRMQLGGVDLVRFITSCVLLVIALLGAHFAANKLGHASPRELVKAADIGLAILTLLGLAALAGVPPIGSQATEKAVVIFGEPSHYGLAFVPLLMFRAAVSKRGVQILILAVALALAGSLRSLTMIVSIFAISAMLLRSVILVVLLVPAALAALALDFTYYSDRLAFSGDSSNLSVLVFLQGWQNAIINLQESHGFGLGFQQFGVAGSIGEIAERLADLLGSYIGLLDGGSTATKTIGEFGVLGIVFLGAFTVVALRGFRFIRRSQRLKPPDRDVRLVLYYSLIISFSFELFLRGVGYFSPGAFLALAAFIGLHRTLSVRNAHAGEATGQTRPAAARPSRATA